MTQVLLDTNIISELGKPQPHPNVVDFLSGLPIAWLSTITLHELVYGLVLLPEGKRRNHIESILSELVARYDDYIITIGQQEARQAALLRAVAKEQGRTLHLADSLMAGTAKTHNLTLATRNTKDFEGLRMDVFNPFLSSSWPLSRI
ncbi:MAG TPA: type II toxin-antitoxin system VapC family toxin [Thiolinea sp.]|nr:type II toxin-antitoxin system VapC family toxin [Thiolinea sp.]